MKKIFITLLILAIGGPSVHAQAIGYQGKKFMIEAGYSPASNLTARYFKFRLDDDYYESNDSNDPLIFKHIPKIGIEYVIFNSGSLVLRFNPWKYTTNFAYNDNVEDKIDYIGLQEKGSMVTLGYKSYITVTPAPLGSYFGVFATLYNYNTSYVESKYGSAPPPDEFTSTAKEAGSSLGLSLVLGAKNIYWDKMTLDFCLEGGIFLKGSIEQSGLPADTFGERYNLTTDINPQYSSLSNTGAFFFVVPTLSVGWLLF